MNFCIKSCFKSNFGVPRPGVNMGLAYLGFTGFYKGVSICFLPEAKEKESSFGVAMLIVCKFEGENTLGGEFNLTSFICSG